MDSSDLVNMYISLTLITLVGLGMALYCIRFKDIFYAYKEWIGFNAMANLGLMSLLLGSVYPGGILAVVTNFFLACTHAFLWIFVRKLMRREMNIDICLYLLPIYILAIAYYTFIDDIVYNRLLISSITFFGLSLGAICELLIPERKEPRNFAHILLILGITLNCAKWSFYILTTPFVEKLTNNFFEIKGLVLFEVGLATALTEILLIISVALIIFEKNKQRKFSQKL